MERKGSNKRTINRLRTLLLNRNTVNERKTNDCTIVHRSLNNLTDRAIFCPPDFLPLSFGYILRYFSRLHNSRWRLEHDRNTIYIYRMIGTGLQRSIDRQMNRSTVKRGNNGRHACLINLVAGQSIRLPFRGWSRKSWQPAAVSLLYIRNRSGLTRKDTAVRATFAVDRQIFRGRQII